MLPELKKIKICPEKRSFSSSKLRMSGRMKLSLLVVGVFAFSLSAQRPKGKRAKKSQKTNTEQVESQPQAAIVAGDQDLVAARALQVKPRATYADACRIILLQRGEFSKYATDAERCRRVSELGILKTDDIKDIYSTKLSVGAAAKAAINAHGLDKSLMFRLTGWSWYALQNAEALGLIAEGLSAGDGLTGAELMNLMDEALAQAEEIRSWNSEENPYKEFGYETYEEMYNNPVGPARSGMK